MQYVGHLDLHRAWERTFRRASLPLEYSRGYHPQPRLNLACALPVGFTSQCELLDAWLDQDVPLQQVQQVLTAALPPGLAVINIHNIDKSAPAMQTQVTSAVYLITFLDAIPDLEERLQKILDAEHLPRVRRDKPYDLRPLIESTSLIYPGSGFPTRLRVQLAAREAATGRPEELLAEMGIKFEDTQVLRETIVLTTD
jgi:radical SAM-linked protein